MVASCASGSVSIVQNTWSAPTARTPFEVIQGLRGLSGRRRSVPRRLPDVSPREDGRSVVGVDRVQWARLSGFSRAEDECLGDGGAI